MQTKVCTSCGEEKELEAFSKQQAGKLGRRAACKECSNRGNRHYYQDHKAEIDAKNQQWFQDNREYIRQYHHQRYLLVRDERKEQRALKKQERKELCIARLGATKSRLRQVQRQWAMQNRERCRAAGRRWTQHNLVYCRQKQAKRRALKKQAAVGVVDYQRILQRDGRWCYLCQREIGPAEKIHFDHVVPLSKGGRHSMENIRVTHAECNLRKSDTLLGGT